MNKRRLLKLADLLEADAENKTGVQFDLKGWGHSHDDDTPVAVSCGTTACAMGLAVLSGAFADAGLCNAVAPWRGNPAPEACDPNATSDSVDSNFDGAHFAADLSVTLSGWAWSPAAAGGGVAALNVSFIVDGRGVGTQLANYPRPPGFTNKTGAPNVEQ